MSCRRGQHGGTPLFVTQTYETAPSTPAALEERWHLPIRVLKR